MTRLNINIKEGTLEVEGEESFVAGVYADFKEQLAVSSFTRSAAAVDAPSDIPKIPAPKQSNKSRSVKTKESLSIVKDLDLSAKSNPQSLRDFFAQKKPKDAQEMNAVFVYYLQTVAGVEAITIDYIYSCYKNVGARIPGALRQSLLNTAFRKGYIDTAKLDSIRIATPGENFVEQDLPGAAS